MAITRRQYEEMTRDDKIHVRPVYHSGIRRAIYGAAPMRIVDNTISAAI